jgi:hypothetical protein
VGVAPEGQVAPDVPCKSDVASHLSVVGRKGYSRGSPLLASGNL